MIQRHHLTTVIFLLGLVAITFLINYSALSGYWRYDDGWLLDYASRFSALDYFLNPGITRGYSLNNLTPFNPLIYDLNLWLFGLTAKGFYAQHLASLAGCAIASYFLLRLWAPPLLAFSGAVTFLAGAPSLFVAQQLMVGHYVSGLLFTILAVYSYLQSLRRHSWRLAALATLFYLLATLCKEVYVPLPLVILFFQNQRLTTRVYFAAPMFIWSAIYMLWRFVVLGSFVGGYDSGGRSFSIINSLRSYTSIPELLFGSPFLAWALFMAFVALLGYLAKIKRLNLPLLVIILLAVLLPLLPLTNFPGITQPNRYLLLPWWLISMTLAAGLAQLPSLSITARALMGLPFIAVAITHAVNEQSRLKPTLERFDTLYAFFLSSPPQRIFYSKEIKDAYYLETVLNGARSAQARIDGEKVKPVGILVKKRSLASVDTLNYTLWSYDSDCNCVRNITHNFPDKKKAATKPNLIIVPISPPFPPLFEKGKGSVRLKRISEKTVVIEGHSIQPPGDLEHELLLISPEHPDSFKVTRHAIQPKSADSSTYEFQMTMDYSDRYSANKAADRSCLLIRSALTPIRLLSTDNTTLCRELLTP